MQSATAPQSDDRELSRSEALSVAADFFRDFDRRVANQRVVDSHAADSAKDDSASSSTATSERAAKP
jgi:hypothetical protein